jgi:predicted transcriptional regulator of viral defense system
MNIHQIRKLVVNEEIDYVMLKSILSGYSNPRDKISRLLKAGSIIKVKKGLYVFGPDSAQTSHSVEMLANLIYGPSAISLEYALSFYGLIPERVQTITSITTSRNKIFKTPVGIFTYQYLNMSVYSSGIDRVMIDSTHPVLIATPEKALVDVLTISARRIKIPNADSLLEYLTEGLRIEKTSIKKLNRDRLKAITAIYGNKKVGVLCGLSYSLK